MNSKSKPQPKKIPTAGKYFLGDKPVDELKCSLCGGKLFVQEFSYQQDAQAIFDRGRLDGYGFGLNTFNLYGHCRCCNCTVSFKDARTESLDLRFVVPFRNEITEYIVMGISSVKYGRVKNLGNYETERTEVEVVLNDGQTPEDGLIEAKRFVKNQLGLGPSDKDIDAAKQLLSEAGLKVT
jgi:hypothetical protein